MRAGVPGAALGPYDFQDTLQPPSRHPSYTQVILVPGLTPPGPVTELSLPKGQRKSCGQGLPVPCCVRLPHHQPRPPAPQARRRRWGDNSEAKPAGPLMSARRGGRGGGLVLRLGWRRRPRESTVLTPPVPSEALRRAGGRLRPPGAQRGPRARAPGDAASAGWVLADCPAVA